MVEMLIEMMVQGFMKIVQAWIHRDAVLFSGCP
jgi:hypothetical protein